MSTDSKGRHKHKCGVALDKDSGLGCGFVWRHTGDGIATCKQNDIEHTCPRCGRRSYWHYNGPDVPNRLKAGQRNFRKEAKA